MIGKVFDIQHFCTSDGPGIRINVFLKGCPLKCLWCHNPESQRPESEIMFYPDRCISCGRCLNIDPANADFVCFSDAKKICGRDLSAETVVAEVLKDEVFYRNSGGGMTLSGGEPLFQFEFCREILRSAKARGIHTAVETCGFASRERMEAVAGDVDLFLFDYKETDARLHRQFTGVDNGLILENLSLLDDMGKTIVLRCPIIPGYNDREDHFAGICDTANRLKNILRVEIEPYHNLGEHKYAAVGKKAVQIAPMSEDRIGKIVERIQRGTGVQVKRV